jgi:hypothetical protein
MPGMAIREDIQWTIADGRTDGQLEWEPSSSCFTRTLCLQLGKERAPTLDVGSYHPFWRW